MACIRKRRNKWVIDFRDQTGKRRWETIGGSKRDAELLLAERLQQVNRHEYLAVSDEKTLAELADAYYSGHIAVNIRESTRKDYEVLLRRHLLPYLGRTRLRAITPQLVEAWRGKLLENGLGRRTTNKAHTLLGALMRYAIRQRWLAYNVAADVRKLREENRASAELLDDNVLSPEEVRALLEQADTRWRPLLMTAVSTGMRQGELLGLKWGDIDWQSGQLHVRRQFSKGRFADLKTRYSRRRIPLAAELLYELKLWKLRCPQGAHDLVFPHDSGAPLNHGILLRSGFYPALRRAKLRQIRFHDLRHTFASLLIAQNVHPKRIQALMGHSTIRITMDIYGHLMSDGDNDAAQKIGALVFAASGSKMVATTARQNPSASKSLKKMEAGVGIEPAYTDLQDDREQNDDDPT